MSNPLDKQTILREKEYLAPSRERETLLFYVCGKNMWKRAFVYISKIAGVAIKQIVRQILTVLEQKILTALISLLTVSGI